MIKVNIVPVEILAKARQKLLLFQASFVGSLCLLVVVIASIMHYAGYRNVQNEIRVKESKLKNLGAIVAQVEELEKKAVEVKSRLGLIEGLLKGRAFYPVFMSEFVRTVPGGIKVTNMTTVEQGNPTTVKIAITAQAQTNDDVANWVRTLQGHPHFSSIELGSVSLSGKQRNFTINGSYTNKL